MCFKDFRGLFVEKTSKKHKKKEHSFDSVSFFKYIVFFLNIPPKYRLYIFYQFGGDGGSRTHVQEHFQKTFSERSWLIIFRQARSQSASNQLDYPIGSLNATGSSHEVFLYKWCQILCLQVNTGWHACWTMQLRNKFQFYRFFLTSAFYVDHRHGSLIFVPHTCRNLYIPIFPIGARPF